MASKYGEDTAESETVAVSQRQRFEKLTSCRLACASQPADDFFSCCRKTTNPDISDSKPNLPSESRPRKKKDDCVKPEITLKRPLNTSHSSSKKIKVDESAEVVHHPSVSEENRPAEQVARAEVCLDLNVEPPSEQEQRESGESDFIQADQEPATEVKRVEHETAPLTACLAYDSEDNYDDD